MKVASRMATDTNTQRLHLHLHTCNIRLSDRQLEVPNVQKGSDRDDDRRGSDLQQ